MLEPVTIILETATRQDIDAIIGELYRLRASYANEKYDKPNFMLVHPKKWYGLENVLMREQNQHPLIRKDADGNYSFYGIPVIQTYDIEEKKIILV